MRIGDRVRVLVLVRVTVRDEHLPGRWAALLDGRGGAPRVGQGQGQRVRG